MVKALRLLPHQPPHAETIPPAKEPGQFHFATADYKPSHPLSPGEEGRLDFACPRGHGRCGAIIIGNGHKPDGGKTWKWNGDADRPSLEPSINCRSHDPETGEKFAGCGWHGHLTNGEFTDA